MFRRVLCLVSLLTIGSATTQSRGESKTYRAVLQSPGGELPFVLQVESDKGGDLHAWILNGSEKIKLSKASREGGKIRMEFPYYDSMIEAQWDEKAATMRGSWIKRSGKDQTAKMEFHAEPYMGRRFPANLKMTEDVVTYPPVAGRWAVKFAKSEGTAIGIFDERSNKAAEGAFLVEGTFLTIGGDYRYLAGSYEYGLLRLSCFDGSHAFLFVANVQPDGTLKGDFWSGASWHEEWTAKRDDKAALADGFSLVRAKDKAKLAELKFTALDGKTQTLSAAAADGKAVLIDVFGSWCPNCHDAADLLEDFDKRYRSKGLRIVGLAFERSGDFERDARQVKRFVERHHTTYPILIAGVADKKKVAEALPFLESFNAYPTFVFLRADGTVRAVYTGFSGPATGDEHQRLRRQFEEVIEELLR